jgi:hypothetical protein
MCASDCFERILRQGPVFLRLAYQSLYLKQGEIPTQLSDVVKRTNAGPNGKDPSEEEKRVELGAAL